MDRTHRRPTRIAAAIALLAALTTFAGCGKAHLESETKEGQYTKAGDVVYQVQLTRLLNPDQRPDDNLLEGQEAPKPRETYLAVFMIIQNKSDRPYKPPSDMKVVDTQGNEHEPLDASGSGFGLSFTDAIPPGDGAPPPDSPASGGPDAASMVLFKLKEVSATDNLPLELEIPVPGEQSSRVELDI
ncbi:MAG: hypothetical protein WDZ37_03020 [Solirubrobacterales bacterium]